MSKKNNTPKRCSWNGLMSIIHRQKPSFDMNQHIYMITPEGHKRYLNIKYTPQHTPYFVCVPNDNPYAPKYHAPKMRPTHLVHENP